MALEVDPRHGVPLSLRHAGEHSILEEAGVQHERVESTKGVDRLLDHRLGLIPIGDVGSVRHRFSPGRDDLVDDLLRSIGCAFRTVALHTEVVHDDFGPLGGKGQRVGATESSGGASDHDDASVTDSHRCLLND